MLVQGRYQRSGQGDHPVFCGLGISHDDLAAIEIDIFRSEAHTLHQAHTGSIKQARHQAIGAIQAVPQSACFGGGEHHRQPPRPLGAGECPERLQKPV